MAKNNGKKTRFKVEKKILGIHYKIQNDNILNDDNFQ